MNPLAFSGRLQSGLGEGAGFVALDWVDRQFHERLGFRPYPGTLNLAMQGEQWTRTRELLRSAPGIPIDPPPGFCAAKCFRVRIAGRIDGAIVLPEVDDYPADKLEIVAALGVRAELGLADGDLVTLRLDAG